MTFIYNIAYTLCIAIQIHVHTFRVVQSERGKVKSHAHASEETAGEGDVQK